MQDHAGTNPSAIVLVGLSHRTTPIELRERFAVEPSCLQTATGELYARGTAQGVLQELVLLSTCNRLEAYAVSADPGRGAPWLVAQLAEPWSDTALDPTPYFYVKQDEAAVTHLLRVACGLDSLILGEAQILGQVGQAVELARTAGCSGAILTRLFEHAVYCGKRARAETAIGTHTTSISHAAVQQAKTVLGHLGRCHALIIGAGEMAQLAAVALQQHGIGSIFCINRTLSHGERLAAQVNGRAVPWHQMLEALAVVDLVISATAAPYPVLTAAMVAQVMTMRNGRPLLLIDIALPRDIEVEVDGLPGVIRYDMDHLRSHVDANLARRRAAIPQVEAIIAQESAVFREWLNTRPVLSTLVELRRRAEAIASQEVENTLHRLLHQPPDEERIVEEVRRLANRMVAKLLHEPTVRLKAQAAKGHGACYARILSELFALEADDQGQTTALAPGSSPEKGGDACLSSQNRHKERHG